MTRYRVTVRAADIELRGYVDSRDILSVLADRMDPVALVIASVAPDDYDPFAEEDNEATRREAFKQMIRSVRRDGGDA